MIVILSGEPIGSQSKDPDPKTLTWILRYAQNDTSQEKF